MQIKYIKLRDGAIAPATATSGAAAADLYALCPESDILLAPMQRALIPTGIAIELPSAECAAFIFARSGLATKNGLTLANGVGVIDSDYRGELQVSMINLGKESICIHSGERIAQLAIMPVIAAEYLECSKLSSSDRGIGGFGSTGK